MDVREMTAEDLDRVSTLWNDNVQQASGRALSPTAAQNVRALLQRYPVPHARCFVAMNDGQLQGFVTCAALVHPVEHGLRGQVEELVIDGSLATEDRASVRKQLVQRGVAFLQSLDAHSIHTMLSTDDADGMVFWEQQGWDQDMVVWSIYADVPGDPVLQQVWMDAIVASR